MFTLENWIISLAYLVSVILFIIGIKDMNVPKTAVRGNKLSMLGMLIAIVISLCDNNILSYQFIFIGLALGTVIGLLMGLKVKMTGVPQMVALLNGFGGIASVLVCIAQYYDQNSFAAIQNSNFIYLTFILSIVIGGITVTGSLIAFGKLQELISGNAIRYPLQKTLNLLMFVSLIVISVLLGYNLNTENYFIYINILALLLGITLVLPIGGADMPVVISLLNSYSGMAVTMTGFVLNNYALIVVGNIVGASGIILTKIMCKAMNRSLLNVLFGGIDSGSESSSDTSVSHNKNVKSSSADEAGMLLDIASKVIFVPGYGMAVSQAQHSVHKLSQKLIDKGVDVKFAIHPVAGRMPGHMNILLAEANIDYAHLYDMDHINDEFKTTDVTIVIGANDVVNPAAKDNVNSPIYGMPILNAHESKTVMVLKRSMNPGFAGIDNDLFYKPNTIMIFGDAKKTIDDITSAFGDE